MDATRAGERAADGDRSVALLRVLWVLWLPLLYPVTGFLHTYPLVELFRSHPTPLRLGVTLAAVALFVGIYLWATWHNRLSAPPGVQAPGPSWLPLAILASLAAAQTLGNGKDWLTLFIFVSASAGARLPARQAAGAVAALALLIVALGAITHAAAALTVPTLVLAVFVGVIGITLVQVAATNRALRAAREEIARLAVSEERLRFARDLHDLLGHNLSHIALKSEVAEALVSASPDQAAAAMREVGEVARTALQEVRATVSGYRQPSLASELRGARELLSAAGIAYRCDGADLTLPADVEAVLGWTVREGVTNVIRHGRATQCTIRIGLDDGWVQMEVVNDAAGPARDATLPPSGRGGGNGLSGVRERVAAIGGRFEAGPIPAGGFRLAVRLPVASSARPSATPGPAGAGAAHRG